VSLGGLDWKAGAESLAGSAADIGRREAIRVVGGAAQTAEQRLLVQAALIWWRWLKTLEASGGVKLAFLPAGLRDEAPDDGADYVASPAKWGFLEDVEFTVLAGPDALSMKESVVYAQHRVIGARPHTQYTAPALREMSLTLGWDARAVADVDAKLERLREIMYGREPVALHLGDAQVGTWRAGDFLIQSMSYQVERIFADGAVRAISLDVGLLEHSVGEPLEPGGHAPPKAVK
jgi:phage protein U